MSWPIDPLPVTVEIQTADGWHDITEDTRLASAASGGGIVITRGRHDWGQVVDPGKMTLVLNNRHGKFTPRNPRSELYGKLKKLTPIRVKVDQLAGSGWLHLPAGAGCFTSDHASLDITGDIDIRFEADLANWANTALLSKYIIAGDQRSWAFYTSRARSLVFAWSPDGTFDEVITRSAFDELPASGRLAVRVTLDVNNGLGGYECKFYTAPTMDGPWTQLGSTQADNFTTSIHSGTDLLSIGLEESLSGLDDLDGKVYRAEVRNGINGTVVASPDFRNLDPDDGSYVDSAGRVWVTAAGNVFNPVYRFVGRVSSWPPEADLSGHDVWVSIEANGIFHALGKSRRNERSPLELRYSSVNPLAYWPIEDETGAEQAGSAILGGRAGRASGGVLFGADTSLPGAARGATLPEGEAIQFPVDMRSGVTEWSLAWSHKLANTSIALANLLTIETTGTAARWEITADEDEYRWNLFDIDGNSVDVASSTYGPGCEPGNWVTMLIYARQVGGDVEWVPVWRHLRQNGGYTFGSPRTFAGTLGGVYRVRLAGEADAADQAVNHLIVDTTNLDDVAISGELNDPHAGYAGEYPTERFDRLCSTRGLSRFTLGQPGVPLRMGAQRPVPLRDELQACATTDGGVVLEDRQRWGLIFRPRQTLHHAQPLEVPWTATAPPFKPTDDDQLLLNDVSVRRDGGSSTRVVQLSGPNNINEPEDDPDGVGVYDGELTISAADDLRLGEVASTRKELGTTPEPRFGSLHFDLTSSAFTSDPELLGRVAALDTGDLLRLTGPPEWLPPDDIDQVIQGYTEEIDAYDWDIHFNATPGRLYAPTYRDDAALARRDTGGALLALSYVSGADAELVHWTAVGPFATEDSDHYPVDLNVGGVRARVTDMGPLILDGFSRTGSGWGTPDSAWNGATWSTVSGNPGDVSTVGGTTGRISTVTINSKYVVVVDSGSPRHEFQFRVVVPVLPTGAGITVRAVAGCIDTSNYYEAQLHFQTSGAVELRLIRLVAGSGATIGSPITLPDTHSAGNGWYLAVSRSGSLLQARARKTTRREQDGWQVAVTDSSLSDGAGIGVAVRRETGNTNGTVNIDFDDFRTINPQVAQVETDPVNGVETILPADTPVSLWFPSRRN